MGWRVEPPLLAGSRGTWASGRVAALPCLCGALGPPGAAVDCLRPGPVGHLASPRWPGRGAAGRRGRWHRHRGVLRAGSDLAAGAAAMAGTMVVPGWDPRHSPRSRGCRPGHPRDPGGRGL